MLRRCPVARRHRRPKDHRSSNVPPVREVALAATFEPLLLNAFDLAIVGGTAFQDRFPTVEVQPAVEPQVEGPASQLPSATAFSFTIGSDVPPVRLWFRSLDRTKLVQLQQDWFGVNWQDAPETSDPYPRYREGTRPLFLQSYQELEAALPSGKRLVPVQAEVQPMYVVNDEKAPSGRRPSSSAFSDDRNGSPMSVYLHALLEPNDLEVADVMHEKTDDWGRAPSRQRLLPRRSGDSARRGAGS